MNEINDGGSAFPETFVDNEGRIDSASDYGKGGMSLREWFAGMALQGLLSANSIRKDGKTIEQVAFEIADAMIAEREKMK